MRAVSILLLVSAAAAGIAALTPHQPDIPPPGRFVTVDGARLHLWCIGQGSPTVVLEAGLGGTTLHWSWLQPELARSTRVCSYDRPGLGWSDPLPMSRDGRSQSQMLHRLLNAAGERGPFILVGHSVGGSYARLFRDQFRNEVQGLVLLDSVQSGYCERMPGAGETMRDLASQLALCRRTARLGAASLLMHAPASYGQLPESVRPSLKSFLNTPGHLEAMQREAEQWFHTMKQVGVVRPLGSLPLLVLSAEVSGGPVRREWMPYWREMQKDLGMLSRQSEVRVVPGANHETIVTSPVHADYTVRAILDWMCTVSM